MTTFHVKCVVSVMWLFSNRECLIFEPIFSYNTYIIGPFHALQYLSLGGKKRWMWHFLKMPKSWAAPHHVQRAGTFTVSCQRVNVFILLFIPDWLCWLNSISLLMQQPAVKLKKSFMANAKAWFQFNKIAIKIILWIGKKKFWNFTKWSYLKGSFSNY